MKYEYTKTDEAVTFFPISKKGLKSYSIALNTFTIKKGLWDAIIKAIKEELK